MNRYVDGLFCTKCGRGLSKDELHTVCPDDGRPLEIRLNLRQLARDFPGWSWLDEGRNNMWRYGPLLPADPPAGLPPAGWTPLDKAADLSPELDLWIKDEGTPRTNWGWNATGSFKDRGMAMVATMAHHFGLNQLCLPTQGNAGDSLATFASALGMKVRVALPRSTPQPIKDSLRRASAGGGNVELLFSDGTIREASVLLKDDIRSGDWFGAATFSEPGWRIEGKKTLGLELAEQLGWRLPHAVVYPTGGGTGILGMWKAFGELIDLGVVAGPRPRMIVVQSSETAPLVDAMRSGSADTSVAAAGDTIAVGLNVPYGIGHFRVLEILRESGGDAVAVQEADIQRTSDRLASAGIGPEGAACVASLSGLVEDGILRQGDSVVVVNTCSPDKYTVNPGNELQSAPTQERAPIFGP